MTEKSLENVLLRTYKICMQFSTAILSVDCNYHFFELNIEFRNFILYDLAYVTSK